MNARLKSYARQIDALDDEINILATDLSTRESGIVNDLIAQRVKLWKKYQILEKLIERNPNRA